MVTGKLVSFPACQGKANPSSGNIDGPNTLYLNQFRSSAARPGEIGRTDVIGLTPFLGEE